MLDNPSQSQPASPTTQPDRRDSRATLPHGNAAERARHILAMLERADVVAANKAQLCGLLGSAEYALRLLLAEEQGS